MVSQEKYITLSIPQRKIEETRSYFRRVDGKEDKAPAAPGKSKPPPLASLRPRLPSWRHRPSLASPFC